MFGKHRIMPCLIFLAACLMVAGCTIPYRVLQDIERPLEYRSTCLIGDIEDGLPVDFKEEDKPSAEDIGKFQQYLVEQLVDKDLFETSGTKKYGNYLVTGRIMEYNKGSGAGRAIGGLIGALMKSTAYVVVRLDLVETDITGIGEKEIIFSGSFKRSVADRFESGDRMFKDIASDFAKVLEKQSE
jgi:hypothetical protein